MHTLLHPCSFFSENVGENSIVSIGLKPFVLSGKNQFIHNSGSVLRVSPKHLFIYNRKLTEF